MWKKRGLELGGVIKLSRSLAIIFGVAAGLYLTVLLLAWVFQGQLIYPAPHDVVPIPDGYQEAILETDEGLALRSAFRAPQGALPVAVFFHGNGDNLTGASIAMVGLADAGFGVMLVEYRGYAGNPGTPNEQGFYRDGRAALSWLDSKDYRGDDIVLVGNSIGSGTAVQMAIENKARALLLISPLTSAPDVAAAKARFLPVRMILRDKFANADKISKLALPILLQHGTADTIVPLSHSRKLAALAKSSELQQFAEAGHELAYLPEPQDKQVRWLTDLIK